MDEPLQELENELKALRPQRPSTLLRARIEHELSQPAPAATRYTSATSLRSWKWLSWSAAAAAAGMLAALGLGLWHGANREEALPTIANHQPASPGAAKDTPGPAPAGAREVYVPVAAASVLYDLQDEGEVNASGEQGRQARYRYVDTYTWKNPATNASLRFSVPRDEVRVVPARFH